MRIKYIDVLKAVAIIAVVLYHAGILDFGYLGVDVFLVIAGYLTTRGLEKRFLSVEGSEHDGFGRQYIEFVFSRIIRLLPLLLLVGALCMWVGYYTLLPDDYENLGQSVIATNFFANNILAAITTKYYWAVVNPFKPLMHTWFIGILVQFYVFYPLLFLIAKSSKRNSHKMLTALVAALAFVSLMLYMLIPDDAWRYYYLPARFFEFAAGGIVFLVYPINHNSSQRGYVYICYAVLLALLIVNVEFISSVIRILGVVCMTSVLLSSQSVLENNVFGNKYLAAIGKASYSIFVWHQVLLAFYRYVWTSHFTYVTYTCLLVALVVLSWLSYRYIEQKIPVLLKSEQSRKHLYAVLIIAFVALNAYAGYIHLRGGVVRDIPELYVSMDNRAYGMHKTNNNDKIYLMDRPFETDKQHWLLVGDSFARDFANVILESPIADSVELSYIFYTDYEFPEYGERFATADKIIYSYNGITEEQVSSFDSVCQANNFPVEKTLLVGIKNFGSSNGQFYRRRGQPDYFEQRTGFEGEWIMENNELIKSLYGDRYLDLISLVIDENGTVPVFTPDHHFISPDTRHFTVAGAKYFATLIDWSKYFTPAQTECRDCNLDTKTDK